LNYGEEEWIDVHKLTMSDMRKLLVNRQRLLQTNPDSEQSVIVRTNRHNLYSDVIGSIITMEHSVGNRGARIKHWFYVLVVIIFISVVVWGKIQMEESNNQAYAQELKKSIMLDEIIREDCRMELHRGAYTFAEQLDVELNREELLHKLREDRF
jgi:hypothetical protein